MSRFFNARARQAAGQAAKTMGFMSAYTACTYAITQEKMRQTKELEVKHPGCTIKWDYNNFPGCGGFWTHRIEQPDSQSITPKRP